MTLTKKYQIIHGEDNKSLLTYLEDFSNTKTYVGNAMTGVEFDNLEDYEQYIEDNGITFENKVVEKEIRAKIPIVDFQLKLLDFDVTEQDIIDTIIFAYENNFINEKKKNELLIRWMKGTVVETANQDLFNLIPLLNQMKGSEVITADNIIEIYKSF